MPRIIRSRRYESFISLARFERVARRRLPRSLFSYISSGAGDELSMRNNISEFSKWVFMPRLLVGVRKRTTETTLFGVKYASPFGITALGAAAVVAYDADRILASAAARANIPYQLSANSITPMEDIVKLNPNAWFAAYFPSDKTVIDGVLQRVGSAGFQTLVVTVDVPVAALREREMRAGYTMPFRLSGRFLWDAVTHLRWTLFDFVRTCLKRGLPHIENIGPGRGPHILARHIGQIGGSEDFDWSYIEHIRKKWHGTLILKGILSSDDAQRCRDVGVDAIIVSNHGGRLTDCAPSPLETISEIRDAVRDMPIILDGGVRRGGDVLKAIALGADAVMIGRPFLYALAMGGRGAVARAIEVIHSELMRDMAFLGFLTPRSAREGRIRRRDGASNAVVTPNKG